MNEMNVKTREIKIYYFREYKDQSFQMHYVSGNRPKWFKWKFGQW